VYPNPVLDHVTIHYYANGAALRFSLIDASGRTVHRMEQGRSPAGLGLEVLDLSDLEAGTYLLSLETGTERVTWRVLKVR
jgi:hypothetical protein